MSAEENNEEQSESPAVEPEVPAADAPAEQADEAAEEAAAEEPAVEDAGADDAPAEEAAPAAPAPADDGEDVEALTPKQQRKLDRARHAGEPRPPRDPEERATERASTRAKAAAARTRSRARARTKHEPGQGTPPAEHAPGSKKVRQGTVVSSKADKTITVRIEVVRRHPVYEKVVRRTATIHVHDEANDANAGDIVRVIESRPLSRTKRWRLVEVLERAR